MNELGLARAAFADRARRSFEMLREGTALIHVAAGSTGSVLELSRSGAVDTTELFRTGCFDRGELKVALNGFELGGDFHEAQGDRIGGDLLVVEGNLPEEMCLGIGRVFEGTYSTVRGSDDENLVLKVADRHG